MQDPAAGETPAHRAPAQGTPEEASAERTSAAGAEPPPARQARTRSRLAGVYTGYTGGKDAHEDDRRLAEAVGRINPTAVLCAEQNRAFMHRAVRWLAAEAGIRQFLDIGCGLPVHPDLHDVAQAVRPDARIAYVDNEPTVLVHAQALARSTPEGRVTAFAGDVRDPEGVLSDPRLSATLDLTRPVAVCVIAVLHFVPDGARDARGIVRRLLRDLPSGSFFVCSHVTSEFAPVMLERASREYRRAGHAVAIRSRAEIERLFDGLELVPPGVVSVHHWRPDDPAAAALDEAAINGLAGVGRVP
ncbi:SAM-dependent methyltransferase [Streptomyces armeniacus]|uniref:SAM-dependent methyltransferase n=1 Tax=Streptomyces armeniacus TaxID=83291 RepID=A0A345XX65_9ACTN|nr:SAM-dependent methyltransferase [Streptomyces armeniacus]AXK36231.1 SAM-dependent methyltransferase [Streptomyces armeniacus]